MIKTTKYLVFAVTLICLISTTFAVPPAPPKKENWVKQADFIAVVRVTDIVEEVVRSKPYDILTQTTYPEVERVLKGTAPKKLRLEHRETLDLIVCRPPKLSRGRFLVFLRRQGDVYAANDWYWGVTIEGDQVCLFQKALNEVAGDIQEIVKNQQK